MESLSESKRQTCAIFEEIKKVVNESGIAELRREIQSLKEQIKQKDEKMYNNHAQTQKNEACTRRQDTEDSSTHDRKRL